MHRRQLLVVHVVHLPLVRTLIHHPAMALFKKFSTDPLDERLSRRNPRLHTIITEIRRAHFYLWRTLGKCDAFDRPTPGAMEPGHCQRVRTDFASQLFGKLFVGGFVRI